jgi:hypothetical protein
MQNAAAAVALVSLLTAAAARASESLPLEAASAWQPSLSAGYGAAYDGLGVQLELRKGHWAAFLGLGSELFGAPPDSGTRGRGLGSLALGARWLSGDGEGAVLSVHAAGTAWDGWQTHAIGTQGQLLAGGTAGWRLRFGTWFLEAGAGVAARHQRYDVAQAAAQPIARWSAVPDLSGAAGLQF